MLRPGEDSLVWHCTNNEIYMVKSGYKLALERKRIALHHGETSNEGFGLWKVLWNLNIPLKIKKFLWRACMDVLSVRLNLHRRGIGIDLYCPVCSYRTESILHCFTQCPAALDSRFMCPLSLHGDRISGGSFYHWFDSLVKKL